MERITQSRNHNITIRITKNEKHEFKYLAKENHESESNWAYHILRKHKNSYGKTENIDQLLDGLKTVIESYEFILEVLKNQIKNSWNPLSDESVDSVLVMNKISIKISEISKLINQITYSKSR